MRWKHLRGGLTRYIKRLQHQDPTAKSIKQFYLWHDMKFVFPYLKSRRDTLPTNQEEENIDLEAMHLRQSVRDVREAPVEQDVDTVIVPLEEPETPSTPTSRTNPPTDSSQKSGSHPRRGRKRFRDDTFEETIVDYIARQSAKPPEHPDLEFFRSILPDMNCLSASQKRRFKIHILQLIEDMSNEDESSRPYSALVE